LPNDQIAAAAQQQRMGVLAYLALFVVGAIVVGIAGAARRRM
jgi:hypothetical protein